MALMLLKVLVLGAVAAAADEVVWSGSARAQLACSAPLAERLVARRPPPPLGDLRPRKQYVWRRGDDEISSKRVSQSGSLEVSRRRDGEGIYQCLVRHNGGFVRGYPIHLRFASMEKQFHDHPANATARSGQPYVLSCGITSAPPANVTWLKDDLPLPEDDRFHIIKNQLLITDVTSSDEGFYRCVATNSYLNKTRISHAGLLEVAAGESEEEVNPLPFVTDDVVLAPRGGRVVLPCPVTGWPRPNLIWKHTPIDERTSELDVVDQLHIIRSLQPDQEGEYSCSAEGSTEIYKTFTVTISEPPSITIPPAGREALRASTVRFNCTAAGSPAPAISWYKDGQLLQMAGRMNLRKSADGLRNELVISGVTTEDAGVYQCFATNAVGTASHWAVLNVTGPDAEAPTHVRCYPVGDRRVKVAWQKPGGEVVAYTLHGTPDEEKAGISWPGQPLANNKTEETMQVTTPLVPYRFQVRAYSRVIKSTASDLSDPAICQGQGVPIKLTKEEDDTVVVSWQEFAEETPGVVQWILQYKEDGEAKEKNVTLNGDVYNYTLNAPPSAPLLVRVLGSKSLPWLRQDLSLVPWVSTAAADEPNQGAMPCVPRDVEATRVGTREFAVTWRCDSDVASYVVCVRSDAGEKCVTSMEKSAIFDSLQPATEYEVKVQAREGNRALGGPFSAPYLVTTLAETPQRFKEVTGRFINSTTLQISWNGEPGRYTVHYSAELKLPVEQWASVETNDNTVLIHGIDPSETTFLMVTGYGPREHSKIETIPPLYKELEVKDLQYAYTSAGVRVWWGGDGLAGSGRTVAYAQNITRPLEQWHRVTASGDSVELSVDPSLPTFVMVTWSRRARTQVLTIPPRPPHHSALYLGVGIGLGVLVLVLLAAAAILLRRRRKAARSPRRRAAAGNAEEAEMKEARRLANGGARGAGEPLLNGHGAAPCQPQSKTPNGRMKRGRPVDAAFDVARFDADATLETVLDDTAAYSLLDTSRLEHAPSRSSTQMSANNSFAKLPDDNMNSEIVREADTRGVLDNSKIQPTLQPNG